VLPHFPLRLLQAHFPLVELALPARPRPRNIHLWCRATLLEDPVFASIKETVLDYAKSL